MITTIVIHYMMIGLYLLILSLLPTYTLFPYTTLFRSLPADRRGRGSRGGRQAERAGRQRGPRRSRGDGDEQRLLRSEEHTSELQSPCNLVCALLRDITN